MENKAYTVRYRDDQSNHHELCTFAKDSFEAKTFAMEKVKYLSQHPNAIDYICLLS